MSFNEVKMETTDMITQDSGDMKKTKNLLVPFLPYLPLQRMLLWRNYARLESKDILPHTTLFVLDYF